MKSFHKGKVKSSHKGEVKSSHKRGGENYLENSKSLCWIRISFRKKYLHRTSDLVPENNYGNGVSTSKSHFDAQVSVCAADS
ncbi:unnamed protein product [Prunus armeniaca]